MAERDGERRGQALYCANSDSGSKTMQSQGIGRDESVTSVDGAKQTELETHAEHVEQTELDTYTKQAGQAESATQAKRVKQGATESSETPLPSAKTFWHHAYMA